MQGPPFGPVKPALQMHCVIEVELAGEFDPDGQAVGAEAPGLGQYDPAGHTAVWIQLAKRADKIVSTCTWQAQRDTALHTYPCTWPR